MRNRNIVEIETNGRMQWQKDREYGRRNYSELGVQRYQRTFGDAMHARDFSRQQQEAMIASGALNKMTSLGMPKSRRSAWILWKKTLRGVKKQRLDKPHIIFSINCHSTQANAQGLSLRQTFMDQLR